MGKTTTETQRTQRSECALRQQLLASAQFERLLLCATSVFSVSLWLRIRWEKPPQRHREHRGCTEKTTNFMDARVSDHVLSTAALTGCIWLQRSGTKTYPTSMSRRVSVNQFMRTNVVSYDSAGSDE